MDYRTARAFVFAAVAPALLPHVLYGDILTQIESAIISFFTSIFNGITAFFGTIFAAIANVLAAIFNAPVAAITSSWTSFQTWANQYGPIAPFLTILMVAAFFLIGAVAIWLVIKFSVKQTEETAEEAEEG